VGAVTSSFQAAGLDFHWRRIADFGEQVFNVRILAVWVLERPVEAFMIGDGDAARAAMVCGDEEFNRERLVLGG
jgi:hypothetical protein